MSGPRARFGGLGALFFLASLGGIALYVQRQEIPEARDDLRKPATILPQAVEEAAAPSLAWQDRLDFGAIRKVPFSEPGAPVVPEDAQSAEPVDPAASLYMQDLEDGHRLLLTLDPVLHEAALTLFRKREVPYAGAVVMDLRDNAILAFAGHSSMDPQVDPLEILTTAWAPAASTFKLMTAASLLEHDKATPTTKTCFHGGLHGINDAELKSNPKLDTRCETLASAIAHSHNLVLGKLALAHLDEHELGKTVRDFQFETPIPFEFQIEPSPAHIPSEAISRAKVAAGFWHVDVSPVHGAVVASIFARRGIYQPPHIIASVLGPDDDDLTPNAVPSKRVISKATTQKIGKMMAATTAEGTARKSFIDPQGARYIPGVEVAGKTGSLTGKRAPFLNYNWFIGYAPADDPEIAVAVVIANEPKWQIKAHYAARRLIQIYLTRRDAIAEHRSAKLTRDALHLPRRDPETGALVALAEHESNGPAQAPAKTAPPPNDEPVIPPVPGPLPKVDSAPAPAPDAG
jgi:peptidoglycan glycosyltransferase